MPITPMRFKQRANVTMEIDVRLTESEFRALEALAGYGTESFLKVFYKHLGEAYLKPHEAGLVDLFENVRKEAPGLLRRTDEARQAFFKPATPATGGGRKRND